VVPGRKLTRGPPRRPPDSLIGPPVRQPPPFLGPQRGGAGQHGPGIPDVRRLLGPRAPPPGPPPPPPTGPPPRPPARPAGRRRREERAPRPSRCSRGAVQEAAGGQVTCASMSDAPHGERTGRF